MSPAAKPRFDGTVTLGNIVQIIGVISAIVLFGAALQGSLKGHEERIARLERQTEGIVQLGARVVALETSMSNITATMERVYAEMQAANGRLSTLQVTVAEVAARIRQGQGE